MQWKRLVDHRLSPAAGREWFIAWLYVGCGGAAGTGVPLLYLPSYDSLGVVGYIAWQYGRARFMRVLSSERQDRKTRFSFKASSDESVPSLFFILFLCQSVGL
jgi:hypothetical protein